MRIFAAFVFCFIAFNGFSQSFRLSALTMYVTSAEVSGTYNSGNSYSGKIKGGFQWGAGAEYLINEKYAVEFTFQNQKTTIPLSNKTFTVDGVERINC